MWCMRARARESTRARTAARSFQKVQGIPSTARRTRVLMQDPQNLNIVFAGTTEGLFRTVDSGATWLRTTGPEVIVNDVYVDPDEHQPHSAGDGSRRRAGEQRWRVLVSFRRTRGFSARQITSYVGDAAQPATIYVGVVNDKAWGGVFVSDNGGLSWSQKSVGLNGQDVFSLGQASDGTLLAGTGHGIYRLQGRAVEPGEQCVFDANIVTRSRQRRRRRLLPARRTGKSLRVAAKRNIEAAPPRDYTFDANVNAIARAGDTLYAATSAGLLRSVTAGESWKLVVWPGPAAMEFCGCGEVLGAGGDLEVCDALVGRRRAMGTGEAAGDDGRRLLRLRSMTREGSGWEDGRACIVSRDRGATWQSLKNLSMRRCEQPVLR